jgi:hypothetical protein
MEVSVMGPEGVPLYGEDAAAFLNAQMDMGQEDDLGNDAAQAREMGVSTKGRKVQGAERKSRRQATLAKVAEKNAVARLAEGKTTCASCGLPFPISILDEDGNCKICVEKIAAGTEITKIDLDEREAEIREQAAERKATEKATKAKSQAKKAAKANKEPRVIVRKAETERPEGEPELTAPEGELPRGWISQQIRDLWAKGYERRAIANALSKALDREVKYQQVFQTVKQAELAATRPMPEGAVPCKVCGTPLVAEDSVAAGIGPICAGKHDEEAEDDDEEIEVDVEHGDEDDEEDE